jgi:CRISPR-associated protein Cmr5
MSHQRSLEQERAKSAWEVIVAYKKAHADKETQNKLRALAQGAPADIQIAGLGQTLAFWHAKHETHHTTLFEAVSNWVKGQIKWTENLNLLVWITEKADTNDYRRATAEALAFLKWVKFFAEGELEKAK